MYKKIVLSFLITTNLLSNDLELNQYFKENNLSIKCLNNICNGENIILKDLNIGKIEFNSKNISDFNNNLNCEKNDNKCKEQEKIESFLNILKKSFLNDLKITNFKSNNLLIEEINSKYNIAINEVLDNKTINYDFFKNNEIDIEFKNLLSKQNEFKLYENILTSDLKELSSIPRENWDDYIYKEVEYNFNLLNIIKKYSNLIDKNNYKLTIETIKNKNQDVNNQDIKFNININSNYKNYNISFEIELINLQEIFNKLKHIENKEFALMFIISNINIKNVIIDIDLSNFITKHKENLLNDEKYKESFDIVKEYLKDSNLIEEEYKNDLEYVEYVKFINTLLSLEKNKYSINIENPDKLFLFKLLNKDIENIDIDEIFDSLDWKFKSE